VPFVENLTPFLADFGQRCTLGAAQVTAIVDTEGFDDPATGVVTQGPSALVTTAQAGVAAPGQAFVAGGVVYSVRQVLREPPDGALTRLVLVRA
jgi:hypothetical protein